MVQTKDEFWIGLLDDDENDADQHEDTFCLTGDKHKKQKIPGPETIQSIQKHAQIYSFISQVGFVFFSLNQKQKK